MKCFLFFIVWWGFFLFQEHFPRSGHMIVDQSLNMMTFFCVKTPRCISGSFCFRSCTCSVSTFSIVHLSISLTYSDIRWQNHQKKLPYLSSGLTLIPCRLGFLCRQSSCLTTEWIQSKDRADWKQIGVGFFVWFVGFLKLLWTQISARTQFAKPPQLQRDVAATGGKAVGAGSGREGQLRSFPS